MIPDGTVDRPCTLNSSKLSTEDDAKFGGESCSSSDLKSDSATKSDWIESSSVSEILDLFSPLVVVTEKSMLPFPRVFVQGTDEVLEKHE